ncbi:phage tail protein [Candidatus Enterovibrio escicola]|uniref:fibronectin type III domain-containing protein n=1 Tax=Candidatus Enterovibrio escicola TaxID=1927127 RepID=UPI001238159E|nr:fibronectin type III domain-containing protein [Candidatus Enterovibrio escacola]
MSQANGVENEYVYNSLGQLTAESLSYSGRTKTLGYEYNAMGYVDETTYPSKLVVSHTVNALGQYQAILSPKTTYASAAKYYPSGQVKSFTYGNGYKFTQSLNDRLLPENLESKLDNNFAIKFEYAYDDNSNVEKITDHVNSAYDIDLSYDELDRMTYAKGKWGDSDIEYDVNGNILKYTLGQKSLTYVYSSDNRLNHILNELDERVFQFSYDKIGNVKSRDNTTSYQYDLANQMIAAGDLSYVYDANGRRVSISNNGVLSKLSMYNIAGKLIYQEDLNTGKVTEHLYLGSRYIASIDNTPNKPTASAPSKSSSASVTLSWNGDSSANKYIVEMQNGNGAWVKIYEGANLSAATANLTNGTYNFRVKACNGAGCGSYSDTLTTTVLLPPSTPTTISVPSSTDTDGRFNISWSASATATKYTLRELKNNGNWVTVSSDLRTVKALSGRANGSYKYAVNACNASGCSGYRYSNTFNVLLPPPVPSSIAVPTGTDPDGAYTVSWPAASTATRYQLSQKVNTGAWVSVSDGTSRSKAFSGKGNAKYQYAVRACNSSGCSGYRYSSTFNVLLPPSVPSSITTPTGTDIDGAFTVSWPAVSTATSYQLSQKVNSGAWVNVISGSSRSKAFSGKGNATYQYAVRACNASGCGGYRYSSSFKVLLPPPVPSSATVASYDHDGTYDVRWNASSTATHYMVTEKVNSSGYSIIHGNVKGTSYRKSGAQSKTYRYGVKACNSSGCSGYRYTGNMINTLAPSSITVPSINHSSSISIRWGSVANRTKYVLQERISSGSWKTILSSTTSTSYTRTGRTNTTYQYRVAACNAGGCTGYKTSGSVRVVLPPSSISYPSKDHDGIFSVTWSSVSGATSYQVQQLFGGRWTSVYSGTARSASLSGRGNGNYYYRVRACYSSSCSSYKQGNKLWVIKPNLHLSLSKTYLNGGQNIEIDWSSTGADSCRIFGTNKPASGSMNYYASCSTTIEMSCKFGSQSISKSQSIIVKYSNCGGGGSPFDEF